MKRYTLFYRLHGKSHWLSLEICADTDEQATSMAQLRMHVDTAEAKLTLLVTVFKSQLLQLKPIEALESY